MNVVLPKAIEKKVLRRAQKYGVSKEEYVQKAVEHALTADERLDAEMRLWDEASLRDFDAFAKNRKV